MIVRLEDLSHRDGRIDIVAEQRIEQLTRLPISFRLKYDGGRDLDPEHRYVVTASLYAGSTVIYAHGHSPECGLPRAIPAASSWCLSARRLLQKSISSPSNASD